MRNRNEQPQKMPQSEPTYTPQPGNGWWAANMFVKISMTSASISFLTTPLNVMLTNSQMGGTGTNRFIFGANLLKGLTSNVIAGQKRGAISGAAKTVNTSNEEQVGQRTEHGRGKGQVTSFFARYPYLQPLIFAQGDLAVSQIFANKGKLQAADIIKTGTPFKMNFHNMRQLFAMAYPVKTLAGGVNFYSICYLSNFITGWMANFSQNPAMNNFVGGAATGAIAAAITHVPNSVADAMVLKSRVDSQGKLSRVSTLGFFKEQINHVKTVGIKDSILPFLMRSKVELPLRTANSMVIFGMLQLMFHVMGDEPLARFYKDKVDTPAPSSPSK
ncbi:periplasmic ligand-binding sensor domain protein [Legionella spiritensis]|uniref:Periplasmic ligand-binding sensor domain protein n=3 Tax=Legionella spiritensis TaxID=452 RepID=A0A0W0Z5C9_LEGSP|nr:periplasmic ligand-binding sensor domain protein [Legionella spiritensis]SNV37405.1 periplasmic ligand-binding sensor domain protein [Legionella spiritensis]